MDDKLILRAESYLELELLQEGHAAELFELIDANREYLKKWLPWLDNNRYQQNTIDFITYSRKQFKESVSLTLAIMYRGKIAGVIGFHKVDWLNHSTSIGYWLGESYYGQGEYRDAANAFLTVYKDYPNAKKVPDSLLKLASSLGELGETSTACATFDKLLAEFTNASNAVRERAITDRAKYGC